MHWNQLVAVVVLVPFLGAFLVPLLGRVSAVARNWFSLCLVLIAVLAAARLVPVVWQNQIPVFVIDAPLGFRFLLVADRLAVFMALVSSFVGAVIVLYSFDYISHYENQNEYYFMVVLFLGSMMGLVFSSNVIFLYLFWEITALACWRLIGFFRDESIIRRADKAFLITVFGAVCMLLGFIDLFSVTGTFELPAMARALAGRPAPNLAVALILCGILSKSATLPFHTWLPDAGVAPSPVTALLHAAVLVKIGVYVYARLFVATLLVAPAWETLVPLLAGVSALVAAGAALVETDIKRIIAYSTISQIGFIFLGLSISTGIGVAGGLLYILMHGLAKGGLFLCAGIVEQNTHTKDLRKLGGLVRTMPVTAVAFLLCALSVMGIPPFGGFFSKFMVVSGAVQGGHPFIAALFILGAFLTVIYLFRIFTGIFFGELKTPEAVERSPLMVGSVAFLAVVSLLAGLFFRLPADFARLAVQQMMGGMIS